MPIPVSVTLTSTSRSVSRAPMVTLPTPWQRGRYTQAIYRTIGVTDCIAATPEEYVQIAVRLGEFQAAKNRNATKSTPAASILRLLRTPVV